MPPSTTSTKSPTAATEAPPLWTHLCDHPFRGFALAREPELLLVWDESDQLTILNRQGRVVESLRVEEKITHAAISDDGSLIAVLLPGPRLVFLDPELHPIAERSAIFDAERVALDSLGRYAAVASRAAIVVFYSRQGRQVGKFEPLQPLIHLQFLADQSRLVGASGAGTIVEQHLTETEEGKLAIRRVWQTSSPMSFGRMSAAGDGRMILTSCHTHGIQRYDDQGRNSGSYHLGGTATHAVTDFAGRTIAAATLEGELVLLNQAGNVRWRRRLARPVSALEIDALGRYMISGDASGEIRRWDLTGKAVAPPPAVASAAGASVSLSKSKGGSADGPSRSSSQSSMVRQPSWTTDAAKTLDQAETATIAILEDPPRIALMTNSRFLEVFTLDGQRDFRSEEIHGAGRLLRTAPGWIAAATDRRIALFDAKRREFRILDLSLAELTHLAVLPDSYGIAVVQECDRIGRATPSGRWIWRKELPARVEELAIQPDGATAITMDDGRLRIFGPAGDALGEWTVNPSESMCLVNAPDQSPSSVEWITLARAGQVLRGHARDGRVLWQSRVPWESWQLHRLGRCLTVAAADGRAMAFDGAGRALGESRGDRNQRLQFAIGPGGEVLRLSHQGAHWICTTFGGQARWRVLLDAPLGPTAASPLGTAALIGQSLAWFPEKSDRNR